MRGYLFIIIMIGCNIGFQSSATSNVENHPTIRKTLFLPSSGCMCSGLANLATLCKRSIYSVTLVRLPACQIHQITDTLSVYRNVS
jgi:hypothetical protein